MRVFSMVARTARAAAGAQRVGAAVGGREMRSLSPAPRGRAVPDAPASAYVSAESIVSASVARATVRRNAVRGAHGLLRIILMRTPMPIRACFVMPRVTGSVYVGLCAAQERNRHEMRCDA